ncbi:hypothetical protein V1509DRAFT_564225 [Lipomyces kononenkoae]
MQSPSMSSRDGRHMLISQDQYLPYMSQIPGGAQHRHGHVRQDSLQSSYVGGYQQPQYYQYGERLTEPLRPSLAPVSRLQFSDSSKFDEYRIQPQTQPHHNSQTFLGEPQSNPPLYPGHLRRPPLATIDPPLSTSESHQVLSLEQYHRSQQQYHRGSMAVPLPAISQFQHSQELQPHLQHGQSTSTLPLAPAAMRTPYYRHDVQIQAPVSPHKSPKSMISFPATQPVVSESEGERQDKASQLEFARNKSSIAALVSPPLSADRHRSPSVSSPPVNQRAPVMPQRQDAQTSPPNETYQQETQRPTLAQASPRLPSSVVTGTRATAESAVTLPEFSQQQDDSPEFKTASTEGSEPRVVNPQESLSSDHDKPAQVQFKQRKSNTSRDKTESRKISGEPIVRERFRAIAPAPSAEKSPVDEVPSAPSRTAPLSATSRPLRKLLPALSRASSKPTDSSVLVSTPIETATVSVVSSGSSSSPTSTTGSSSTSPSSTYVALERTPPAPIQHEVSKVASGPLVEQTKTQSTDKPLDVFVEVLPARPSVLESSMRTSANQSKSPQTSSSVSSVSETFHAPKPVLSDSAVIDQGSSNGIITTTSSSSVSRASMSVTLPVVAPAGRDISSDLSEQKGSTEPRVVKPVTAQAAVVSGSRESTPLAQSDEEIVHSSISIQQQPSSVQPACIATTSESTSGHDSSHMLSGDVHVAVADNNDVKTKDPCSASTPSLGASSSSTAKGKLVKKMRIGPKSTSSPITVVPISHKRMAKLGESEDHDSDEEDWTIRSKEPERAVHDDDGESESESLVHSAKRQKRFHSNEAPDSKDNGVESKLSTVSGSLDSQAREGRAKTKFEHNFSAEAAFNELLAAGKNLQKALALIAPATSEDRETANPKKQLDFTEVALHNGREHITQLKISRDRREMCRQSWLQGVIKGRAELSSKQNNSILRLRQWLKWWWTDIAARHSENQLQGSWGKRTQISKAWQAAYDVSASIVHARLRQCERVYELQYRCGWPALVLATMTTPALGPTQRIRKSHLERGCDATQISQKDWSEFIALAESRINEIRNVVLNECGYDGIRRILEKAAVTKPYALQSLALFPPYSYAEDEDTIVVMPRTVMRSPKVVFDKRKKHKNADKKPGGK